MLKAPPVTLVTAIYERSPNDALGGRGLPVDYYLTCLARMAHLGAAWVIYTDPSHLGQVESFGHSLGVELEIVPRSLERVPHFDEILAIRERDDVRNKPSANRCHILCFAKSSWLAAEAVSPRFGSDHVYWIDAGLAYEGLFPSRLLSAPERIFNPRLLSSLQTDTVTLLALPHRRLTLHDVNTETMGKIAGLTRPLDRHVVGGLFGGPRRRVMDLALEFEDLHTAMLDAGLLGTEENVLSMIAARCPSYRVETFETWYHEETDFVKVDPGSVSFHTVFERWAGLLDSSPSAAGARTVVRPDPVPWPFAERTVRRKLIAHNPCNEHTRYFRNYNLFWDKLTEALKAKYDVVENRHYAEAHISRMRVELRNGTSPDFCLLECEYVIEDADTGEFWIMSVSDDLSHGILEEAANPLLQKVLVSQFLPKKMEGHIKEQYHKYAPWIYFPAVVMDLEPYYHQRQRQRELVDKMYFRGSALADRPIVSHFGSDILTGPNPIAGHRYFDELITHKIGLSIGGRGEICYRDVEYMAVGIPFLRFEYQTKLAADLIPNHHYISVPFPDDLPLHNDIPLDRLGGEQHARLITNRFLEVKDDREFLDYIAGNARRYYEDYLCPDNRVQHTLNLLNL